MLVLTKKERGLGQPHQEDQSQHLQSNTVAMVVQHEAQTRETEHNIHNQHEHRHRVHVLRGRNGNGGMGMGMGGMGMREW